jgi:acyl carrier protein
MVLAPGYAVRDNDRSFYHGVRLFRMTIPYENEPILDKTIYQKLTSIFRTIFENETIVLCAETSESNIAGWDSFNNASLIAAIEKEFAIRFRTAELQSLHTVGNFVNIIRTKLKGGG